MLQKRSPLRAACLVSACLVVADQLTKSLVVMTFLPGQRLTLLVPWLHLTYVQNTGAAFGLFKGQQGLFVVLSLAVIAWILFELGSRSRMASRVFWGSALILGGAIGNVIDRLRVGHVIDFIGIGIWPLFNVADSAITIGIGLLLLHSVVTSKGRGARGEGHGNA